MRFLSTLHSSFQASAALQLLQPSSRLVDVGEALGERETGAVGGSAVSRCIC